MSTLVAAGPTLNHLKRVAASPTTSPAAHSLFPASNLSDGLPSQPLLLSADATQHRITIDKNVLPNGGFELGFPGASIGVGERTPWVVVGQGSGNIGMEETTTVVTGTKACRLICTTVGAGNHATVSKAIVVGPGERWNFQVWLRGDGTRTARARAVLYPGPLYWNGTTWSASPSDWATQTTASYAVKNTVATIPPFATLRQGACTLILQGHLDCSSGSSGQAWFDEYAAWPSTTFVGVFGHNFRHATVDLRRDGNGLSGFGGAGTLHATMTVRRPTFFWYSPTPADDRWWRIEANGYNASGAPSTFYLNLTDQLDTVPEGQNSPVELELSGSKPQVYIGELVFAQPLALSRMPSRGLHVQTAEPQERLTIMGIPAGRGLRLMSEQVRRYTLKWSWLTAAQHTEWRDVFRLSDAGAGPLVFVPNSADPEGAVVGMIPPAYGFTLDTPTIREGDGLTIQELPHPHFIG